MRSSFTHMHVTMSPTYRRVTYLPTDLPLPAWFVSFGGREGGIGARACGFVVAVCV